MSKISGSCLCGEVTYECVNEFEHFHLCHCIQCQKASGSAHVSNLFIQPDKFSWLTGESLVKRYDVPGRTISNAFCNQCGSNLPYLSSTDKAVIVPAGCLDEAPNLIPQDNIFCSEKATWYDQGIIAKSFAKFPD